MSPLLFSVAMWDRSVALITGRVLGAWSGRRRGMVAGSATKND